MYMATKRRPCRIKRYQFRFNPCRFKQIMDHWTLKTPEGHICPTPQWNGKGHMWSYQVETARNSIRALWRNQLPKMTSTSLTLPRNLGKSVRRRRIFRVADRWSLVMFQTILFPYTSSFPCLVYRALFICHLFFKLLWFSYKFPDKTVCYRLPFFSLGLWHSCGIFSLYFNCIYLIFILFWKYMYILSRTC